MKASCDAQPASRIIVAEAMQAITPFSMGELSARPRVGATLRARDLDTEVGRAAYAIGRGRGHEEGARAGREKGHAEGVQALELSQSRKAAEVTRDLENLTVAFRAELARLEERLADDVVALAVSIARQVLRRELSTDRCAVTPSAMDALRALAEGAGRIEMSVNPADAAVLREQLAARPGLAPCQLREDASIRPGGCRIDADTGMADATLETRWEAAMAQLGRSHEALP